MMNVLVIGSGGREHALALKISGSPSCGELFCLPGNPGTASFARNLDLDPGNFEEVLKFVKTQRCELVVIGPEKYLCDGLSDFLREKGVTVFGPSSHAAKIESDKAFAKELMMRNNIPTAQFRTFTSHNKNEALSYCNSIGYPVVIKASGLASGKGVIIASSESEAADTLRQILDAKIFGESGEVVVVEEFLHGEEASVFAICDGEDFVLFPAAQDHKRIGDGDSGKNTGGMGAYAPAPAVRSDHYNVISERIVKPVLNALSKDDYPFIGCLFCGLMISGDSVNVIEYNARFGDPETQALMGLIEGDFLQLLHSAASGKIEKSAIKINQAASVCVVAASYGYPDKFESGFLITGLDLLDKSVTVYHSGTELRDGNLVTKGGRVLGITSVESSGSLRTAISKAYSSIGVVSFENIYYRKDIGAKGLKG